jgi:hypothetical protein
MRRGETLKAFPRRTKLISTNTTEFKFEVFQQDRPKRTVLSASTPG